MKAIICEMCNSNNVVKEDGVYVCQNCGTKYSVDEARKLMVEVEGTVDVSGSTVKIDSSGSVENLIKLAENAFDSGNKSESETYCNKVLEIDPCNAKAWHIKGKAAGWQSSIAKPRIYEAHSCYKKTIEYSDDKETMRRELFDELVDLLESMRELLCKHVQEFPNADNIILIEKYSKNDLLYLDEYKKPIEEVKKAKNKILWAIDVALFDAWYDGIWHKYHYSPDAQVTTKFCYKYYSAYRDLMVNGTTCAAAFENIGYYVEGYNGDVKLSERLFKNAWVIAHTVSLGRGKEGVNVYSPGNDHPVYGIMSRTLVKARRTDPSFEQEVNNTSGSSSGGCYVATSVYGSYDCPEVWTLRRFRDYSLAKTWYGRVFIHIYYAVSPSLVRWFGHTTWFKEMWKGRLDRMVSKLQEKGFEDTPYEDKNW